MAEAETVICWRKYDIGPMSKNIWAPEIHYIDDKWYIYFAAARADETSDGMFEHRTCSSLRTPQRIRWRVSGLRKGSLSSIGSLFHSIQRTAFEHRGVRYLVWAQKDPTIYGNSNLYMAPLASPWTIEGPQVCLTQPDYEWEKIGYLVNEGAAVIIRNGRVFISYSASATDHHYCMGLLWADENSHLMDPANWHKSPVPVFGTDEESGQYGPGHNSFTIGEDGETDILIYHARNYKEIEGDPLDDPNRHMRAQVIRWDADGMPVFGKPVPDAL